MTNEHAQPEAEPVTEQPGAAAVAAPEAELPKPVTLRVELVAESNEKLKSLAALWGETKTETARKLLTGQVDHHYQVNKRLGKL